MAANPLDFTQEDLNANRRGELTAPQREHLNVHIAMLRKQSRQLTWTVMGAFALVIIIVGSALGISQTLNLLGAPVVLGIGGIIAGVFLLIFILMSSIPSRKIDQLARGNIRVIEGQARLVTSIRVHYGPVEVHGVEIERHDFSILRFYFGTPTALRHFKESAFYRV